MSKTTFSLELKKQFPGSDWPWLLLALRQDDLVWRALQDPDFASLAFERLPNEAHAWSPAALSMLKLEDPPSLSDLRAVPLQPLDESQLRQASRIYEGWIQAPEVLKGLEDAGLLALILREQYRISGVWQDSMRVERIWPGCIPNPACLPLWDGSGTGRAVEGALEWQEPRKGEIGGSYSLSQPKPSRGPIWDSQETRF